MRLVMKTGFIKITTAAVLMGGLLLVGPDLYAAAALSQDLRSAIQSLRQGEEVSVIVKLRGRADLGFLSDFRGNGRHARRHAIAGALKQHAESARKQLKPLLESAKVRNPKHLWLINGVALTAPAELILELASHPAVESIRTDATLQVPTASAGASAVPEWNLTSIRAPELWNLGYTGAGVVVANMDTGVDINHPDLQARWRGGTDSWFDPNGEHAEPYDAHGHGTQTMGVIVGGDAGGTAIGVAPGAQWIAVKIYDDAGHTTYSTIHLAFQWLLDPDGKSGTDDGADVVNASWVIDLVNTCSLEFQPDIDTLKMAGIAIAFAAGNYGPYAGTSVSPANNSNAFSVGAVDEFKNIAYFSSRGPSPCDGSIYPELVAPGINIRTSDLTYGGVIADSYSVVSGTSFSAPHAAGAMALLISAFPDIAPADLETGLKASAFDLAAIGPDSVYGYGLVDVVSAYNYIRDNLRVAVSPSTATFNSTNVGSVSAAQTFTVTNRTSTDFIIGNATITGPNASEFVKQNDTCSGRKVEAAGTCTVQIQLTPLSAGAKNAALTIPSIDAGAAPLTVLLNGTGAAIAPQLTVTYPNGGEIWVPGTSPTITWTYSGDPGPYVKIQLMKGSSVYLTIGYMVPTGRNGRGSYTWNFYRKDLFGQNLRIVVSSTRDSSIMDSSDRPFTILSSFFGLGQNEGGFVSGFVRPYAPELQGITGAYPVKTIDEATACSNYMYESYYILRRVS
jgi:subtilisin family serine protease